jgi:quercetin dioxygenase-like cupin family protein
MNSSQNPDGEVGTHFLLENEHVKVWNLDLQPGQASDWHHHHHWYLTIVTVPGTLKAEFVDGSSDTETFQAGDVHFRDKDSVHRVINVSDSRYVNVIVELKDKG